MKLPVKPVEGDANVVDFTDTFVVFTCAQAGSAKVEAQDGKSQGIQRLCGVEDDFVV
jgi:hypothetical protein